MTDPTAMSATALARSIRNKKLSAVEAAQAHLARIAARNPALRALVLVDEKAALARARAADRALAKGEIWGPLHGVPITIKEAFDVTGWKTTSSFAPLKDNIAVQDATAVARLRAAGAVFLGKTNVPELCMDVQSNSPLFGEAANPWDHARTPGGSTGGGAAAVAARLSPLELGSDIGGSVRIPSHFCGLYGLKTSEWRIPATGHVPDLPGQPRITRYMGTFGFLARSVADLRLGLQICAGPDGIDTEVPPAPLTPVKTKALNQYRIAFAAEFPFVKPTEATGDAVKALAKKLSKAGAKLREALPEIDYAAAWSGWAELIAYMSRSLQPLEQRQKYFAYVDSEDPSRRATGRASKLDMAEFARVLSLRDETIRAMDAFMEGYDAWITPVAPIPAFVRQKPGGTLPIDDRRHYYWQTATSYSFLANFTGQPCVVVPAGFSAEGMPIGVQIVGRRWGEMEILVLAEAIEKVIGPAPTPPGY
ncbi:MAG: Aspartyl-tRNA(Asn) amidotransferase subunit [Alphaproteobacteria bacterium]|jgi:amidase|nr:Aspartyl-tRNA(Asn) amidotransferase subunit [Alphaproteobacteria bacterium]